VPFEVLRFAFALLPIWLDNLFFDLLFLRLQKDQLACREMIVRYRK
jgi:hypothetical protein